MVRFAKYSEAVRCGLIALGFSTSIAGAKPTSSCYVDVVQAYNRMLVGRTLVSDDGATIQFGRAGVTADGRFIVAYSFEFSSGSVSSGVESLHVDNMGVYVDQIIENVTTRRYFASVEAPYNVFRIRPLNPQNTDFITRDCIRRSESEGTICYIKVRYMNDVIVSEYREQR